jgi:hypothetical protein
VITIPFDYDERSAESIVPICINEIDSEGNHISPELIGVGVVPVADPLRKIAARVLHDVWRASEITDFALHSYWRKHRNNFGEHSRFSILRRAQRFAEDSRVGGRRARRRTDVELFETTIDSLQDQFDLAAHYEATDTLDQLLDQLERLGMYEIRAMVPMILRGCSTEDLVPRFGPSRNTISQRFYRGMRKAARAAGISW